MSLIAFPTLLKKLKRKEYRDANVSSNVKHAIARQIRAIREQRNWTQTEMGRKAGTRQNIISRLENPDYGQISIQTLLNLASAFDVGLIVRFVKFDEFIRRNSNVTTESFEVPKFNDELNQAKMDESVTTTAKENEMATKRDTYKYQYKVGNKIVHVGITDDLERREQEHQQKWSKGHIKQVGIKTTEEAARKWEEDKGYD